MDTHEIGPFCLGLLFVGGYLGAVYALTTWAIRDAEARGIPGWTIACLVFFLFPVGPAIWVLLRPPLLPPAATDKAPFDLERFRVQ